MALPNSQFHKDNCQRLCRSGGTHSQRTLYDTPKHITGTTLDEFLWTWVAQLLLQMQINLSQK